MDRRERFPKPEERIEDGWSVIHARHPSRREVDAMAGMGTDLFTLWQRAQEDRLELKIESSKEKLMPLVVDDAAKIQT
ncbi:MAG: hypothetical protein WBQ94_05830 [Terracidiphilus sp.]